MTCDRIYIAFSEWTLYAASKAEIWKLSLVSKKSKKLSDFYIKNGSALGKIVLNIRKNQN